jgi:hypothetical protein
LTNRVIAFSCAVEPLTFRVGLPPQLTFDGEAVAPVRLSSPTQADKVSTQAPRMLSAAANSLALNGIASDGTFAACRAP